MQLRFVQQAEQAGAFQVLGQWGWVNYRSIQGYNWVYMFFVFFLEILELGLCDNGGYHNYDQLDTPIIFFNFFLNQFWSESGVLQNSSHWRITDLSVTDGHESQWLQAYLPPQVDSYMPTNFQWQLRFLVVTSLYWPELTVGKHFWNFVPSSPGTFPKP